MGVVVQQTFISEMHVAMCMATCTQRELRSKCPAAGCNHEIPVEIGQNLRSGQSELRVLVPDFSKARCAQQCVAMHPNTHCAHLGGMAAPLVPLWVGLDVAGSMRTPGPPPQLVQHMGSVMCVPIACTEFADQNIRYVIYRK